MSDPNLRSFRLHITLPCEMPHNSASRIEVNVNQNTLLIRLPGLWPTLSWAPFNGGVTKVSTIFNHQCGEFKDGGVDGLCREVIDRHGLPPEDTVGLLTGAEVHRYRDVAKESGPLWVRGVVTVGLDNTRAAGDAADVPLAGEHSRRPGTINLILMTNALPRLTGQLEALQVATMAKTAALIEAGVRSKKSGQPATGTGTDCIVIASSGEIPENDCGMHTPAGELIGKIVRQLIGPGVKNG